MSSSDANDEDQGSSPASSSGSFARGPNSGGAAASAAAEIVGPAITTHRTAPPRHSLRPRRGRIALAPRVRSILQRIVVGAKARGGGPACDRVFDCGAYALRQVEDEVQHEAEDEAAEEEKPGKRMLGSTQEKYRQQQAGASAGVGGGSAGAPDPGGGNFRSSSSNDGDGNSDDRARQIAVEVYRRFLFDDHAEEEAYRRCVVGGGVGGDGVGGGGAGERGGS